MACLLQRPRALQFSTALSNMSLVVTGSWWDSMMASGEHFSSSVIKVGKKRFLNCANVSQLAVGNTLPTVLALLNASIPRILMPLVLPFHIWNLTPLILLILLILPLLLLHIQLL